MDFFAGFNLTSLLPWLVSVGMLIFLVIKYRETDRKLTQMQTVLTEAQATLTIAQTQQSGAETLKAQVESESRLMSTIKQATGTINEQAQLNLAQGVQLRELQKQVVALTEQTASIPVMKLQIDTLTAVEQRNQETIQVLTADLSAAKQEIAELRKERLEDDDRFNRIEQKIDEIIGMQQPDGILSGPLNEIKSDLLGRVRQRKSKE